MPQPGHERLLVSEADEPGGLVAKCHAQRIDVEVLELAVDLVADASVAGADLEPQLGSAAEHQWRSHATVGG